MKIIEARDGFINFEADENIYLSMFIQAKGDEKSYIAQVNQMKKYGNVILACAKILFLYDGTQLMNYDKTLPSKDAEVYPFEQDILKNSVIVDKPVIVGKTLDNSKNVFMDLSAFNKKMLISVDDREMNNILVNNLSKQFENLGKKTLIIDTLGVVNGSKYIAGKDFKLPLDTSTLSFMYESCLNDATAESKSTIAEVFRDLSEYSNTVPFVPFGVLKSIIDDMVDKEHIFRLFVLKNRLANFEKMGYFATSKEEVTSLDNILSSNISVIDLSKLNVLFQNRYLEFIYSKIDSQKTQVILELGNTISKKNLKLVMVDSEVSTLVSTHSKFVYLNDIKEMFENFIIEPTVSNNEYFKVFSSFFASMRKGLYLTVGTAINYIPVVSEIQNIDDFMEIDSDNEEETPESDSEIDEQELSDNQDEGENENLITEEPLMEDTEVVKEPAELQPTEQTEEVVDTEEIEEVEEVEEVVEPTLSTEEILAGIEQKSQGAIDSVSENLTDSAEIDIFGEESDEDIEEDEDIIIEDEEVDNLSAENNIVSDDTIDAEYTEITEESIQTVDETEDVFENDELQTESEDDVPELLQEDELIDENDNVQEDIIEDLSDNNSEVESDIPIEPEEVLLEEDYEDALAEVNDDSLEDSTELPVENEETSMVVDESDLADENILHEEEIKLVDNELLLEDGEIGPEDIESELSEQEDSLEIDEKQEDLLGDDENFSDDNLIIEELNPDEISDNDIVVDISDEEKEIIDEDTDQQIIEDVDKVFTTLKEDNDSEDISDADLDLIDELNSDEELEEYAGELEEVSDSMLDDGILDQPEESIIPEKASSHDSEILEKRESNTPIVPVYDADIPEEDMVVSDDIQQGDSVVHAKYGNGIVEKMIKYGTKTLFSINFENIGRRLLDPTLTEIKKL